MEIFHMITFTEDEEGGRTFFTVAIAENHNVAARKILTSDIRIDRSKVKYVMILDNEQVQGHLEEVQRMIENGKLLTSKHSSMLVNDTMKETN